jgi:hypothetical protein
MRSLAKVVVGVAICLAAADSAAAVDMALPFVSVSLPRTAINIGEVWGPGLHRAGAEFMAHVVANCPYHVEASFQGFRHETGAATVSPRHLSVAINGKNVPVGDGRVQIARGSRPTPANGVDVPVDLEVGVTGLASYPAGRYRGALVITVMAAP